MNTPADLQDKLAGDGFCLDEAGVCSLRAAITEANAFAGGTVIVLPAGIYTQTLADFPEDANLSGDWDITSRILIQGESSANTIIQANTMPDKARERVMHILNGAVVDLSGVTIRNGKHLFVSIPDAGGGGIAVEDQDSGLTLYDVIVENNISEDSGGGIRVGTRGADLTISNCAIRNNRAGSGIAGSTAAGGGIDIDSIGGTAFPASHQFTDVSITGNIVNTSVASAWGGGISATSRSTGLRCTRCTISDNQSISTAGGSMEGYGGGLYTENTYFDCSLCRVSGNLASHLAGGARVFHPPDGSGSLIFVDSTISDNSAPTVGGIMTTGAALLIGRSTISGNTATNGETGIAGGNYNDQPASGGSATMFMTASTVSGNRAARGGGIYGEGPVSLNFCTIASNTATIRGGGLLQDITTTGSLKSTIIADNESPIGPDLQGTFTSQNYNHIENLVGSTINLMANDVTGSDPKLGNFGFHGGHTKTHVPQPDSPVLNQIPLFINQCHNISPSSDQRGLPRLTGERCDKGSVEVAPGDYRQSTPFDYDADGRTDISVFRPSAGAWYIQRSTEGFSGTLFGLGADRIVPADYDGDGKTDIAVFRPWDQHWYIVNSSDGTFRTEVFGLADDLPAPADYDGDGKADVCVFRPSDGTWYLQRSSDGSFMAYQFGAASDRPTVGDFDGDGKSDFAVFRTTNSVWVSASQFGRVVPRRAVWLTDRQARVC